MAVRTVRDAEKKFVGDFSVIKQSEIPPLGSLLKDVPVPMKPCVFISCVSNEFRSTRNRVAQILHRLGYEPVWQEIFGTESGDLRQMLCGKIDDCDGLIQFVGDAYGFEPSTPNPEFGRVSYTQFEFLYARQQKKKTWLVFPGVGCTREVTPGQLDLPAAGVTPDPATWQEERRELQQAYREKLSRTDHIRHEPATDEALELVVERLRAELAPLRSNFRRWQRLMLAALLALLVGGSVFWWYCDRRMSEQSSRILKLSNQLNKAEEKRGVSGGRLLDEFSERMARGAFSARGMEPDLWVSMVLADMAREHNMTVDEVRQFLFAAQANAVERVRLAGQLRRASETETARLRRVERDGYKDLGAASFATLNFSPALESYQQALQLTHRDEEGRQWAGIQLSIGNCQRELGIRAEGVEIMQRLDKSVTAFREALKAYGHEAMPQNWAAAQNDLGNALSEQATRSAGAQAGLLTEAVTAYREALKVRTREALPQDWAMTQNNLGAALSNQAARDERAQAAGLLAEAVTAFREALKVYTREALPQDWAMTQNNLGGALSYQAKHSEGAQAVALLTEAVTAYREALKVRTREALPQNWATTQNNLGLVLADQAKLSEGAQAVGLLTEAMTAYREALKVRTREALPQDWATTQNNLGRALSDQARRHEGAQAAELLTEAVMALHEALKVYTREALPQNWAMTQSNLAAVLSDQAERSEGAQAVELLAEAATAYRGTLMAYTREAQPQSWAAVQNNLGVTLSSQAKRSERAQAVKLLSEAATAFREALKVYTEDQFPMYHRGITENLVRAETILKEWQAAKE